MTNFELGTRFRLKAPDVVARVIDGEAILIAFETGSYYSARGAGGFVVDAIQRSATLAAILDAFAGAGAPENGDIPRQIGDFVAELQAEGLIETGDGASAPEGVALPEQPTFEPPVLEKYRDLEDLLVLDPIHDVDAAGWPVAKAER